MTPLIVTLFVVGYFVLLLLISYFTGKSSDKSSFYLGNRKAPWPLVAFGMIGASLSGVTFISIPGVVGKVGALNEQFSYMQVVFGYLVGYVVIATVLLPLYYRLKLTSIYGYLLERLGFYSYKTGAAYFLLSRVIGASFRLFLVATVLQLAVFDAFNIPFYLTVLVTIGLIWVYTFKNGIKTIIYTDTLQTLFMLLAVVFTIFFIGKELNWSIGEIVSNVQDSSYSKMFYWDPQSPNYFFKQFFSGMFICIVMTGLDQDMMQKNLACPSISDAQKNMFSFSIVLVFVNLLFLGLGALLYLYANQLGIEIPTKTDQLYPLLALKHFSPVIGGLFVVGLIAAAYSSADSALTALTTSFCIDILGFERVGENVKLRTWVHVGFSGVLFLVILLFNQLNDGAIITELFKVAGYTYGPLLGMFAFGLFSKRQVLDKWVPVVCIISPIICYFINANSVELLGGYKFGFEILILNGFLTFVGIWGVSRK
jgi:Na+/proline symporter